MRGQSKATRSPCRDICEIDGKSRLCVGCFRTLEEIAQWARCSDSQRRRILAALPNRARALKAARAEDEG